MAVTPRPQSCVLCSANPVVLNGHVRPVVHGVRQSLLAGLASDNDKALSGPLGDGRDSCQTTQGGVIAPLQDIPGFCEQRGEDDPSHSRQGCEDLHVMVLHLPRLAVLRAGKLGDEPIEAPVPIADAPDDGLSETA